MQSCSKNSTDSRPKIVVLGAAGQMTSMTVSTLLPLLPNHHFVLTDIRPDPLYELASKAQRSDVDIQSVDIYDPEVLRDAIRGARLVVHGAGPFHKTAKLVRGLCIENGADYIDIDDDNESTLEGIELDRSARAAGLGLYVGHGASPGFTNLLALDLMQRLDKVVDVEVAWTVGDEGEMELGRAVAEHTMHIGAGDCVTWRAGQRVIHRSFDLATKFPMGPSLGEYNLYECAHPETITLPWTFPQLNDVICWGGMHPQAVNGILKGVARAQSDGRLTMDEACGFMQDLMRGDTGSMKAWKFAFGGMREQVRKGENTLTAMVSTLFDALRGVHRPTQAGMAARVRGWQDNIPVEIVRTTNSLKPGTFLDTMATMTGMSTAAFILLALQGPRRTGFLPPEKWADPNGFFRKIAEIVPMQGHAILTTPVQRVISTSDLPFAASRRDLPPRN